MAGVDFDFSDVDEAFNQFDEEVKATMAEAGEIGVQYAKENGDYEDRTGTLRKSNEYKVEADGLVLKNETEYASYVEGKDYDVLSGGALEAWKFLNDKTR
ncbi:HK97 gp10 family phage protein [Parabacteroides pacaensis]|uniref:HK97 gp10 family phage protein n=1 Tax=Parabacteroides pacaensis TaxID=2086575 RepID=UPI000D106EDE|nr:HK97 gp10 family phage protein [Parabacteroides pacaensis]